LPEQRTARKTNLRPVSYFSTSENRHPAVHVHHAIHHNLTTISPQPKPPFSQNTPQKPTNQQKLIPCHHP